MAGASPVTNGTSVPIVERNRSPLLSNRETAGCCVGNHCGLRIHHRNGTGDVSNNLSHKGVGPHVDLGTQCGRGTDHQLHQEGCLLRTTWHPYFKPFELELQQVVGPVDLIAQVSQVLCLEC